MLGHTSSNGGFPIAVLVYWSVLHKAFALLLVVEHFSSVTFFQKVKVLAAKYV